MTEDTAGWGGKGRAYGCHLGALQGHGEESSTGQPSSTKGKKTTAQHKTPWLMTWSNLGTPNNYILSCNLAQEERQLHSAFWDEDLLYRNKRLCTDIPFLTVQYSTGSWDNLIALFRRCNDSTVHYAPFNTFLSVNKPDPDSMRHLNLLCCDRTW